MSLITAILAIVIFIIVYKFLDDQFSLLLYGIFLIYVTLNFETYFSTGLTETGWTPFVVVTGLLTALTFGKFIYFVSKMRSGMSEREYE